MWHVTVKGLWAHKRRLLGTFAAVALGIAFLSGTLVLGDTLKANFDDLFTEANAGIDTVVPSSPRLRRACSAAAKNSTAASRIATLTRWRFPPRIRHNSAAASDVARCSPARRSDRERRGEPGSEPVNSTASSASAGWRARLPQRRERVFRIDRIMRRVYRRVGAAR